MKPFLRQTPVGYVWSSRYGYPMHPTRSARPTCLRDGHWLRITGYALLLELEIVLRVVVTDVFHHAVESFLVVGNEAFLHVVA